ncbi:MAG: hypothetical protein LBH72_05980 [Proteiniphilum sp.]|jgi:hypothetical protein|nr:hypothetical protein [Proteiniphilum sp.]
MKKIRSIITLMLLAAHAAASPSLPADTAFHYGGRRVVISENDGELNVSVYRDDEQGDAVMSQKIYEGIFTGEKSVERVYENRFEISVPDIIKPKSKRRPSRSHLSGFGVGFVNLPEKFNFDGELASIIDLSRSLQYNLIPFEASWRMGNSNFTGIAGMGIQFNSIHWQNNKAIEVRDYKSVVTTAEAGYEYRRSRLHYTCLTFPFLIETNWNLQHGSHFFVNIGAVAKVKTASSSRIWWSDGEGRKQKTKFPGELNIRPVTLDLQIQAGIDDFGLFAAWSPFSLFRNGKGPAANQTTLGLQYYF